MEKLIKESLWKQFGASIDMLENAIRLCPQEHWDTEKQFWYNAYHSMFFTDYYLSHEPAKFSPPAPFSLFEFEDVMPERTYTKAELLIYVEYCREKCHDLLSNMTLELVVPPGSNKILPHLFTSLIKIISVFRGKKSPAFGKAGFEKVF